MSVGLGGSTCVHPAAEEPVYSHTFFSYRSLTNLTLAKRLMQKNGIGVKLHCCGTDKINFSLLLNNFSNFSNIGHKLLKLLKLKCRTTKLINLYPNTTINILGLLMPF